METGWDQWVRTLWFLFAPQVSAGKLRPREGKGLPGVARQVSEMLESEPRTI